MSDYNLPPRQPELVPEIVRRLPEDGRGQLAMFDADGTLWRNDASDDFAVWMMEQGHAPRADLWNEYLRIYREDHAAGCRFQLQIYKGLSHERFLELVHHWWRELSQRHWISEVLESLYLLADRGYTLWIVTGSPTGTMAPLETFLPVHRIVGMDFALDEAGVITGLHSGISCADEGKAEKVRFLWGDQPIPFAAGNGKLDVWMMELATQLPWVVYPNAEFAEVAVQRGWPILPRPADFVEEQKLA